MYANLRRQTRSLNAQCEVNQVRDIRRHFSAMKAKQKPRSIRYDLWAIAFVFFYGVSIVI
jgi:type VI protein secretion system component VasF